MTASALTAADVQLSHPSSMISCMDERYAQATGLASTQFGAISCDDLERLKVCLLYTSDAADE